MSDDTILTTILDRINALAESTGRNFERLDTTILTMRAEMGTMRAEIGTMRAEIGTMRADIGMLRADLQASRTETRGGFARLEVFHEVTGRRLSALERPPT